MGARAQVVVKDSTTSGEGVAFYTHWGSGDLPQRVARALERGKSRWNDTGYLARIIFCELMDAEDLTGLTGYGIEPGSHIHGDLDYSPIVVDDGEGTVTHGGVTLPYHEFIAMQLSGAARQR